MVHQLKTWPEPFRAVFDGTKRFEYRKNDRKFAVGDTLVLREWEPLVPGRKRFGYTGRRIAAIVTYIVTDGFGIPDGYCVMSLSGCRLVSMKTVRGWK